MGHGVEVPKVRQEQCLRMQDVGLGGGECKLHRGRPQHERPPFLRQTLVVCGLDGMFHDVQPMAHVPRLVQVGKNLLLNILKGQHDYSTTSLLSSTSFAALASCAALTAEMSTIS